MRETNDEARVEGRASPFTYGVPIVLSGLAASRARTSPPCLLVGLRSIRAKPSQPMCQGIGPGRHDARAAPKTQAMGRPMGLGSDGKL